MVVTCETLLVLPANAQHQHVDDFGMGAHMKGAASMRMAWCEDDADNNKCAVP